MLSTTNGSPFSNSSRPRLTQPSQARARTAIPRGNTSFIHPAAIRVRYLHTSTISTSGQRQTIHPAALPLSSHSKQQRGMSPSSQDEQLEKGGFGAVSGAEELTQGKSGSPSGTNGRGGKSAEEDRALDKGGFGAVTGAEEVRAKL